MKRFEIVITAEHEKEVGDELMKVFHEIILNRGCKNVSASARTLQDKAQYQFSIPDFMRRPQCPGKETGRR